MTAIWDGPLKVPRLRRTNPIYIKRHLAKLEPLAGKTANEIVHKLGVPSSATALSGGQMLLQWSAVSGMSGAVHVALVFDATTGVCRRVQHVYAA